LKSNVVALAIALESAAAVGVQLLWRMAPELIEAFW